MPILYLASGHRDGYPSCYHVPDSYFPRLITIGDYICQPLVCNLCSTQGHKSVDCPNKDKCCKCGQSGHFARSCTQAWAAVPLIGAGGAQGDFPALHVPSGGGPLPAPTSQSVSAGSQVDVLSGAGGVSGSGGLSLPPIVNAPVSPSLAYLRMLLTVLPGIRMFLHSCYLLPCQVAKMPLVVVRMILAIPLMFLRLCIPLCPRPLLRWRHRRAKRGLNGRSRSLPTAGQTMIVRMTMTWSV